MSSCEPSSVLPTRVAFVSHRSDLSGAPRCLLQILQLLDRERFQPIAICPGPGSLVQAISALDIPVCVVDKFPPRRWWGMRFPALCFLAKLAYRLVYVVRLFWLFRRYRVQVVFLNTLHSSGAALAASLNRSPVIVSLHEYRLRFSLTSPLRRWIVLHSARYVIASSGAVRAVAEEYGADPVRITVAGAGVDTRLFAPLEPSAVALLRQTWGVEPSAILFGAAGALVRLKGFQDLLAAMPKVLSAVPGCWLFIAGSVPEGEDVRFPLMLEEQIAELGIGESVRFMGQIADMNSFFNTIDILVVPSYEESYGLVALEAMSAAKPVVATAVGGLPEIVVPEETGVLVTPCRVDELAAAMIRLGSDQALCRLMGKAGAERVRTMFTPSAYIAAVGGVLQSSVMA
jgi:glycosyltransferase involved in cell wall biosynthesis